MSNLKSIIETILETKQEIKDLDATKEMKVKLISSLTNELKSTLANIPVESGHYHYIKINNDVITIANNGVIVEINPIIYTE